MKIYFISLTVLLLGAINCGAQTIRYDTIPDPRKSKQPESQMYQTKQPKQQKTNTQAQGKPQQQKTNSQAKPQQQEISHKSSQYDKKRLVFGGSFGMSFGSNYSSVNVSPQVGYVFSKYFTAGGGLSYFYYKNDFEFINTADFSQNYLGLNVYGRVSPIRYISFQFQPEIYQMWANSGHDSFSETVPSMLVGGGVNIPAGKGAVSAMIYYDVLQDDWSPYGDQLFYSIGYTFSF